jgi:uncharacterized protein
MRTLALCLLILAGFSPAESCAQSLLWEVRGNGLPAPSHLFGTIHAICPSDMAVSDSLFDLLLSDERIALELDMDDPSVSATMAQEAFMPGDTTLLDLLDSLEFARMSRFFTDSVGMRLEPMKYIKPLFFFGMMMKRFLGCEPTSYEQVFSSLARQKGRAILGIETPREQLDVFSSIPLRQQAEMVLDMIDSQAVFRSTMLQLQRMYLAGDLEELHALASRTTIEYGRYNPAVLQERNHRWIPRLVAYMTEAPTFIAVGAGHLGGPDGLISLLRARGYTVTAVLMHLRGG